MKTKNCAKNISQIDDLHLIHENLNIRENSAISVKTEKGMTE